VVDGFDRGIKSMLSAIGANSELLLVKPSFIYALVHHHCVSDRVPNQVTESMFGSDIPNLKLENPVVLPNTEHLTVDVAKGPISAVVTSNDERKILFADTKGNVTIIERETGAVYHTVPAHRRAITSLDVREDGRLIAAGCLNGEISLWTEELHPVQVFTAHKGGVNDVAFSECGRFLASGGDDGKGRIHNLETSEVIALRGHTRWVNSVTWVDGRLVTGSEDGTICVWTTTGGLVRTLIGHVGAITGLSGARFSDRFVSVSKDGSARVWSINGTSVIGVLKGHKGTVQACSYDFTGRYIATAGSDRSAIIWNAETFVEEGRFPAHAASLNDLCWTPEGALVTGGVDRKVRVWPVNDMRAPMFTTPHGSTVRTCAVSRDAKVLVSGSWDYSIVIWDAVEMVKRFTLKGHEGSVECVTVDPLLDRVLSASTDGTLRVWDIEKGHQIKLIDAEQGPLTCAEVAFGGRLYVSGGRDGTIKVWDADTDELWFHLHAHKERVRGSAVHPDGRRVATVGYDGSLAVWDVVAGVCQMRVDAHSKPIVACTFSDDGHEIVTTSTDGTVKIWDIRSGGLIASIDAHDGAVLAIATIDNSLFVTAGADRTLRVWNAVTTQMVHEHGLPVSPKSLAARAGLVSMGDSMGNVWRFRWKPLENENAGFFGEGLQRSDSSHVASCQRI